jgi:predicted GNAT family acetyltransferase
MGWRMANRGDIAPLRAFVLEREWRCVPFSARLRESLVNGWGGKTGFQILVNESRTRGTPRIVESLMLTRRGLVIPVFDRRLKLTLAHNRWFRWLLNRYGIRLHTIMGCREDVFKTETLFEQEPSASLDYYLMVLSLREGGWEQVPTRAGLTARQASPQDASRLFGLQKGYELEEVYLDPSRFDPRRCLTLLRKSLKKQVIFFLENGEEAVAKAGTNERGFRVDQIGGVFTRVDLRNRGLGDHALKALLKSLAPYKEQASLYVKKDNPAALALYKKLQFKIKDEYRISYYTLTQA